ncbi:MAG TPA: hypothetical protein VD995_24530 [Azospirillum sp.]|nr:hypothetical protein [Azospirillum sp.]
MESARDSLMAIVLLLVTLGAIVGTLLVNADLTVIVLLLAVVINSAMLVNLTFHPKG